MTISNQQTSTDNDNAQCGVWDDQMATWYVEKWGEHPMHDKCVELAEPTKNMTVLDIGCGSGPVVRRFAQFLQSGEVIGIDPTAKMIELAKQQTNFEQYPVPISYVQAGAEQLPCDDKSVDLVIAVNSLHHWQDVPESLKQIRRVLKDGGKLVLIDELWDELPEFEKPQSMDTAQHEHVEQFKDLDTVKRELLKAGFSPTPVKTHRSPEVAVSVISAFQA